MSENLPARQLLIRSRPADGYQFSESTLNNYQHVLTDWLPRAIYSDLTDDTASIDVLIRKDFTTSKGIFSASFMTVDGSAIKRADYGEERLIGKTCQEYDRAKTHYQGKKDGFDCRIVYYSAGAATTTRLK